MKDTKTQQQKMSDDAAAEPDGAIPSIILKVKDSIEEFSTLDELLDESKPASTEEQNQHVPSSQDDTLTGAPAVLAEKHMSTEELACQAIAAAALEPSFHTEEAKADASLSSKIVKPHLFTDNQGKHKQFGSALSLLTARFLQMIMVS